MDISSKRKHLIIYDERIPGGVRGPYKKIINVNNVLACKKTYYYTRKKGEFLQYGVTPIFKFIVNDNLNTEQLAENRRALALDPVNSVMCTGKSKLYNYNRLHNTKLAVFNDLFILHFGNGIFNRKILIIKGISERVVLDYVYNLFHKDYIYIKRDPNDNYYFYFFHPIIIIPISSNIIPENLKYAIISCSSQTFVYTYNKILAHRLLIVIVDLNVNFGDTINSNFSIRDSIIIEKLSDLDLYKDEICN